MDIAQVINKYRECGQKITPQRLAVLKALEGDRSHPTAAAVVEKVHRDNPYISPATVYRVLNELAAMGEIQSLALKDGTTRFDPNAEDHAHLLCERCGRIDDVPWTVTAGALPGSLSMGYRLNSVQVIFRGVCPRCQGESVTPAGL